MKEVLRRTWVPIFAVTLAQILINSRPVSVGNGGVDAGLIMKAILYLALFLMTSFIGSAVHVGFLRRRSDASLSTCFLDGAMIGMLSNLLAQVLSIAAHGLSLDAVMPPSGDADRALWISKLVLSFVIVMIFGFTGLIFGGMGGGLVGLVSIWTARNTHPGGEYD
jgi:hypothetical protein